MDNKWCLSIKLLLSIICFNFFVKGKICEIQSISQLTYPKNTNILVAFDIDNTIFELSTARGSDAWFYHAINYYTKHKLSYDAAFKKVIPHYFHYQKNGTVKPVETDTIKLIDTLQKNNIPTVALTARSKSIIDLTIKQLNSININLNKNHFANRTFTFKNTSCPSYLKNGVIFCGNNKKGEILRQFLKEVNMKPSLVIFIDDKRKYLEDVEANLTKISIPFLGFRYGYLDEKVKNFQFHESMLTIPA